MFTTDQNQGRSRPESVGSETVGEALRPRPLGTTGSSLDITI